MRLKADLTLFIIAIVWGSAFVAQRVAAQLGSVYFFNAARYILAGLVVLPFVKKNTSLPKRQFQWMFLAGFLLFLAAALQQVGMLYTTAGNAGFITSLYVVLVPIVIFVGWKEKPHWMSIIAVIMAGVGAFFLSTSGQFQIQKGDSLELIGALFWAFHVVVLGKFVNEFDPFSFSVGQLMVCGFLNLLFGMFLEVPIITWSYMGAVAYTAIFSLGLCYTLQVWAQKHSPPADAALILSLESVFAVVAGWLLLDEILSSLQIVGCVIILLAVGISQWASLHSSTIGYETVVEDR